LLAGIPNRPTKYDPNRNLENALHRQKIILKEMYTDGRITKEQYDEALAYKFELENEDNIKNVPANTSIIYNKRTKTTYKNPELTTIVEDYLAEIYDEEQIYTSGLKIYTTIDLDYQKVAKETFNSYPYFKNKEINGAMITLDPFTGGIVSIVGGKNFKAGNFDRATMARRQLGSSFKPFVYLEALQNGFTPYSVVVNDFVAFGKWAPKNFDGRYTFNSTLVNSLNLSLNIPAVKLMDAVTVDAFKEEMTDKIKLSSEIQNLTTALGSVDSTPVNTAANFSIFVNGGYIVKPNIIREIRDNQDILIYVADIEKVKESRINQIDFSKLSFGKTFADHMFICEYTDGQWQNPTIKPYAPITLEPSASVFHYGQAVFEGMKAYKDDNGHVFLFRPQENYKRINENCNDCNVPLIFRIFYCRNCMCMRCWSHSSFIWE